MSSHIEEMHGYPIGQQDFMNIRKANAIYVDKTRYIGLILQQPGSYYP